MSKLVLMENDVFMVSDDIGDVVEEESGHGLFCRDVRHLSLFGLAVNGQRPLLLSSSGEQNYVGNLQLVNPALELADGRVVRPQTISIRRNRFIQQGLHERIGLLSYNPQPIPVQLVVRLAADFRDIFDVRGWRRDDRGRILPPRGEGRRVIFSHRGVDGTIRQTVVTVDREPDACTLETGDPASTEFRPGATLPDGTVPVAEKIVRAPRGTFTFNLVLEPQRPVAITLHLWPGEEPAVQPSVSFDGAVQMLRRSYDGWNDEVCQELETDNHLFNRLLQRSQLDLRVLTQDWPTGPVPAAGIPWFACPFGRDSLITGLQTLILNPSLAVGVLRFLAAHQGTRFDDWRDEEPGKILHELRRGDMARAGEVPHTPYFGSVDSTPLFLLLFAETMRWLGDEALLAELLPAAERALAWVEHHGDLDGDGYLEFKTRSRRGLGNHGWKDSGYSLQDLDGTIVRPPVALVEVQAYAYAARLVIADLYQRLGRLDEAERLVREARALKERFNRDFWLPDEEFFAQALDQEKRPVPAIASNAGHALLSGIVDEARAAAVVRRLVSDEFLCGWGIRTLSSRMPHFNPMSYHNGSVWPHDNALIAAGMKRSGFHEAANLVTSQVFQAGLRFRYNRLPELFCGFDRDERYHSAPAEYPVSCSPQAWAAGSAVLLFQTMLGLEADAANRRLYVDPTLPAWLRWAAVRRLRVGRAQLDLLIERRNGRCEVAVTRSEGDVEVVIGHPRPWSATRADCRGQSIARTIYPILPSGPESSTIRPNEGLRTED